MTKLLEKSFGEVLLPGPFVFGNVVFGHFILGHFVFGNFIDEDQIVGLVEQSRSSYKDHPIAGREYPSRFPPLGHIGD